MKKKNIIIAISAIAAIIILWFLWVKLASPTKVALVNFQNFQVAKMIKSSDKFIRPKQLTIDDFDQLKKYDAILIFAMGIRMTDEHRTILEQLKEKGIPIYSTAVTDPVNNITSLDSSQAKLVGDYLGNGGKSNYKSLFNYIRKDLTGKKLFNGEIKTPVEIAGDVLFHLDEDRFFENVADYQAYYREKGFYKPGAPKVAVITGIAGPFDSDKGYLDSLITSLEEREMNVYPLSAVMKRLSFLQDIEPDAVIYFPHGRMLMGQGDMAVEWLKTRNIPLFSPITLNSTYDDWMNDPQGMAGGFLSQSVVMPELDGGIVPMALVAQYVDDEGLYIFKTIPEKLTQFSNTVANYLKLRKLKNSEKKVAIYYFKGAGNSSLVASGMEVIPSLYNFIKKLKEEGYTVNNLPSTEKEFEKMIMEKGPVFGSYAEGNITRYLESGYPELVPGKEYGQWLQNTLSKERYDELIQKHGKAPGNYYTTVKDNRDYIAVTRIDLGNIVLLPQPTQGTGENSFAAVHGDNPVPPHHYMASYLWVKNGFKADALIHFGTHGSLEFILGKQVALSYADWSDRLIGDMPHFYYYTISNVGEGIIAKRRSYATLISYLNPPFIETGLRKDIAGLQKEITQYLSKENRPEKDNLSIKAMAVKMGLHRDLRLDSVLSNPYNDAQIESINNYAEELCAEKITGGLYTMGVPFEERKIISSVELMAADPIAYSLAALDKQKGKVKQDKLHDKVYFAQHYTSKANAVVKRSLTNPSLGSDELLRSLGITKTEIREAEEIITKMQPAGNRMMTMMMEQNKKEDGKEKKKMGHPSWIPKTGGEMPESVKKQMEEEKKKAGIPVQTEKEAVTKEEREYAQAVMALKQTVEQINHYRQALKESPQIELDNMVNALNGGFVAPSSGGDFISNPATLPTGRNLYSINAEATPSIQAWDKGVLLANEIIADYQANHNGEYPQKVSVTLWSGSFIESEGATLAQLFYLLGVEPVRDQFGRVLDIRLIPEDILQRPRIDVVVQTSGQFRDLAASRLSLLQKAIDMAAESGDQGTNYVAKGKVDAEKVLLNKGYSPKDARELSTTRIFGGVNGMAGTGITGMVESGSQWENENEIARVYLNNMGATYGDSKNWGNFREGVFEAALQNTDLVIQPRQSHTWGALSLDHVYEFMGGMTLTVRNVTGKDPDNYFNDLRNRYNARAQTLQAAIGVESRTTILNPTYIKEQLKGGASSASGFTEVVKNTYGWNVMKPSAIDNRLWNDIYDVYVEDKHDLLIKDFFRKESPAALQEMTAVMLETIRKGYWKASEEQISRLSALHSEMVQEFDAACSGFTCDNPSLINFISRYLDPQQAQQYQQKIDDAVKVAISGEKSMVLKKEEASNGEQQRQFNGVRVAIITFVSISLLILLFYFVRRRRK